MPRLLTEEEAARVDFYKDQMSEADKARAVEKLDAYHADRRAKEAERTFQAFSNPTTVDAWDTTGYLKDSPGTYLDGEQDQWRKRMANTQFLASEYGHPLDVVTREYDRYAFDYAAKNFGDTTALEPAQLFERIKPVVEGKRTAAKTGYEAAIKGGSKFVAMREFQRANPGLPAQAMQTFERTYDEVAGAIKPWRPLMAEALAAGHALEVGNGGEAERAKVTSLIDTLADMPERERGHVLVALHQQATAVGKHSERGITGTFTGSAVRVIEDMFGGNAERLPGGLQRQLKSGQTSRSEPIRNEVDALAAIDADMQDRRHGSIRARHNEELPLRQMTPEEQAVMNKVFDRERKREHVVRQWAQVARKTDPFNDSVLGKMAAGAGSSVALIAPLTMGPQGVFAAGMGYAQTDYDKMMLEHPDMDKGAAADTAAWSGAIQAGLDKLELFGLGKLAPNVANIIMGKGTRELVKSTALQVGATFFFENVQEGLQDLTLPTVQSLASALSRDVPSVDWDGEMENFWGSRLDVAVGVLPLTLLGIGVNTVSNRESVLKIMADNVAPGSLGIAEEERVKIQTLVQSGNAEGAQAALQAAWSGRDPALAAEFQERYQQAAPARQAVRETLRREAASLGVSITRGGDGQWFVNRADGTSVAVDSAERAALLLGDLMQAAHEAEAEAFNTVLDSPLFANADKVTIQGSSLELKDGELVRTTHAETEVKIIKDAAMLAAVRAQMAGLGLTKDVEINGSNTVFAETVGAAAKLLIEINKSTQQPLTITGVHESVEGNYKRGLLSGAFTEADVMNALSRVAAAIDLSALERRAMRARAGASKQDATAALTLRQRLDKVVAGEATSDELRETMVELAVMDILERDANGRKTGWQAGTLRRIIDAEMERATDGQTLSSLGKLRAWINAARSWFAGVFGTVRAIQKAKESGKLKEGDEFSSFVDKLLNLEESQFAKAVEGEAVAMTSHSLSLAKWSKADTLKHGYSNEFLDSKDWQGLRDAIAVIDPRAGGENGGLTSQATGPETVSAELSKLYQAGFIAEPLKRIDKVGGEHNVEFRGDRVYKQTFPETFGAKFDAKKPEVLVHASPLEYLKRWRAFSEIFPAVRFEGVVRHSDGTASLQISQPLLSGPKPTLEALESQLKEDEWKKAAIGTWTKTTSRGLLRITDVKPDNFAVVDDVILPLDVITSLEDSSGTSFSLSPARRLDLVTNRVAMLIDQRHLGAQKFAQNATSNLQRVRSRWADMPAPKTKAELDRSQAELVNTRRAELEEKLVGEIEFRMGGVHDLVTKLREHPLGDALLRSDMRRKRLYLGGLMAPAKWRAEQLARGESIPGDYDGAEGLPAMFFKGNQTPDDVAKELHGLGIIKGDSADDLWSAMHSMLDELATNKEQMASYKEQLREAAQSAKEEAEYEGRAWRAERDAEQARLGTPREAAIRDLAVVEAVAVALPAEVRAKMPTGWASIAGLKTDKEFANAIAERVKMIDRALTAHWKAKNLEEMNSLVLLGQGKTSPGKKPRGTATPEVHEYFKEVAKVVNATPGELAVMRLGLAEALNADEVENEIELTQLLHVIDLWGDFEDKHVADQTAALETGWETYRAGRNAWWEAEAKRLEGVRANAQTVLDAQGTGTTGQLLRTRAKRGQVLNAVGGEFVDVGQYMRRLLGDIPIVQKWERKIADAFLAKEFALAVMRKKWDAALESAMPRMSKSQRERRFFELHTKRSIVVELTEEKMNALLNAKQRDELSQYGWEPEQITDTARMTEAEAMTVLLTWAQPRYRDSLQRSGFSAGVVSKLEEALSPESKSLRLWMQGELQAQHGPLNEVFSRMAGINLPNTPNYWPGRFYSAGQEQEIDVMGQGPVGKGFADGFLKERKNHAAYIKLDSAFATFWAHINQSEHWRNLAEPVRDMRGVFRNPQVKRGVEAGSGKQPLADMNSWLDMLESNGTQAGSGAVEKVLNRWLGSYSQGRLALNPFSIIRQAPAMFNVGLDAGLTPGMLFKGAGSILRNPSNFLDIYRELFDSDVIFARLEGGMSPEVRNALNEFWKSGPGMWKSVMDKGMEALGFTDALFTTIGGVVAYESKAIELERAGMTPQEAHIEAMQAARNAMEATAQPTTVNRKSLMEVRSQNAVKKSVMMFLSDGRQKWAFYQESVIDILKRGKKAKKESWNRLLWMWLVIGPASQIITSAIRDSIDGGDDDELFDAKNWAVSDFIISSVLGPFRGFFLAGQLVETLADRIAGRKVWEGSSGTVTDIPEDVGGSLLKAAGYLTDDKDQSAGQYGKLTLDLMSNVGGAPGMVAGAIKRVIKLADQ